MAGDVTIRRLDEMSAYGRGVFVTVGADLGITSFGINVERWPACSNEYPEHDETGVGQEEVYLVLRGSATLRAGGEEYPLEPGTFARVGPRQVRKLLPGPEGADVLCLGGIPGEAFRPSGPTTE
jgi:mannose-6-phosphate isomerase-like protein (cupin superfamily)